MTLTLIGRHFLENHAKVIARSTLSFGVAQITAPAMAGDIATATGSYHGALVVAAGVMAAGMLLILTLRNQDK